MYHLLTKAVKSKHVASLSLSLSLFPHLSSHFYLLFNAALPWHGETSGVSADA